MGYKVYYLTACWRKMEKTGKIALHLSVNMDCSVEFA